MKDFTEELTEETVTELEPVRQTAANDPNDWIVEGGGGGGSGDEGKPKNPVAIAVTEPEETESAKTEESETSAPTEGADATEATVAAEAALQICHDHDGDASTPIQAAEQTIAVEDVAAGDTYQLEAAGPGNDMVKWESLNRDIADVNEMGLVTFTGEAGEVTIQLWRNDGTAQIADSVIFNATTAQVVETTAAPAAEEKTGGLMDNIVTLGLGALVCLLSIVVVVLLVMRSSAKKDEKRREARKAARAKARAQEGERTAVQAGQITPDLSVPAEDAVAAVQPMNGIRTGVYQALGARKDQQDSYGMTDPALYAQQGILALVADGMGGLANGKAVSSALVNTFLGEYRGVVDREAPTDALIKLAISANQRINQMLMGADRSGSTLVSVMVRDGLLYFLTVGDSRIYLYRGGALLQLNREHIYQEELAVKAVNCQVPLSQVAADRQAHALTSFFGSGSITYMDRNYEGIRLVPGDRVLLCSDGVFGTLSQAQMERAMEYDVRTAAETLKEMVLDTGKAHQDNNTCVILEYLG